MVKITAKKTKKGQCQLTIEGEMTIYHANEMKEEFLANLEKCKSMEMDLTAVSEKVLLTSHSPAVLEVIELYGMEEYFGDPLVLPSAAY